MLKTKNKLPDDKNKKHIKLDFILDFLQKKKSQKKANLNLKQDQLLDSSSTRLIMQENSSRVPNQRFDYETFEIGNADIMHSNVEIKSSLNPHFFTKLKDKKQRQIFTSSTAVGKLILSEGEREVLLSRTLFSKALATPTGRECDTSEQIPKQKNYAILFNNQNVASTMLTFLGSTGSIPFTSEGGPRHNQLLPIGHLDQNKTANLENEKNSNDIVKVEAGDNMFIKKKSGWKSSQQSNSGIWGDLKHSKINKEINGYLKRKDWKRLLRTKKNKESFAKIYETQGALSEKNVEKFSLGFAHENSYTKLAEVQVISVGIATPERIRKWAEKTIPNGKIFGEVLNANTLHHKTFKPIKGGLFCERIFGPLKDFECSCGKTQRPKQTAKISTPSTLPVELKEGVPGRKLKPNDGSSTSATQLNSEQTDLTKVITYTPLTPPKLYCPVCDVEYTWSVLRRYQLGYIQLASPVTHIWYVKGSPNYISSLLGMKKRDLDSVIYCSQFLSLEFHLKDAFLNSNKSFLSTTNSYYSLFAKNSFFKLDFGPVGGNKSFLEYGISSAQIARDLDQTNKKTGIFDKRKFDFQKRLNYKNQNLSGGPREEAMVLPYPYVDGCAKLNPLIPSTLPWKVKAAGKVIGVRKENMSKHSKQVLSEGLQGAKKVLEKFTLLLRKIFYIINLMYAKKNRPQNFLQGLLLEKKLRNMLSNQNRKKEKETEQSHKELVAVPKGMRQKVDNLKEKTQEKLGAPVQKKNSLFDTVESGVINLRKRLPTPLSIFFKILLIGKLKIRKQLFVKASKKAWKTFYTEIILLNKPHASQSAFRNRASCLVSAPLFFKNRNSGFSVALSQLKRLLSLTTLAISVVNTLHVSDTVTFEPTRTNFNKLNYSHLLLKSKIFNTNQVKIVKLANILKPYSSTSNKFRQLVKNSFKNFMSEVFLFHQFLFFKSINLSLVKIQNLLIPKTAHAGNQTRTATKSEASPITTGTGPRCHTMAHKTNKISNVLTSPLILGKDTAEVSRLFRGEPNAPKTNGTTRLVCSDSFSPDANSVSVPGPREGNFKHVNNTFTNLRLKNRYCLTENQMGSLFNTISDELAILMLKNVIFFSRIFKIDHEEFIENKIMKSKSKLNLKKMWIKLYSLLYKKNSKSYLVATLFKKNCHTPRPVVGTFSNKAELHCKGTARIIGKKESSRLLLCDEVTYWSRNSSNLKLKNLQIKRLLVQEIKRKKNRLNTGPVGEVEQIIKVYKQVTPIFLNPMISIALNFEPEINRKNESLYNTLSKGLVWKEYCRLMWNMESLKLRSEFLKQNKNLILYLVKKTLISRFESISSPPVNLAFHQNYLKNVLGVTTLKSIKKMTETSQIHHEVGAELKHSTLPRRIKSSLVVDFKSKSLFSKFKGFASRRVTNNTLTVTKPFLMQHTESGFIECREKVLTPGACGFLRGPRSGKLLNIKQTQMIFDRKQSEFLLRAKRNNNNYQMDAPNFWDKKETLWPNKIKNIPGISYKHLWLSDRDWRFFMTYYSAEFNYSDVDIPIYATLRPVLSYTPLAFPTPTGTGPRREKEIKSLHATPAKRAPSLRERDREGNRATGSEGIWFNVEKKLGNSKGKTAYNALHDKKLSATLLSQRDCSISQGVFVPGRVRYRGVNEGLGKRETLKISSSYTGAGIIQKILQALNSNELNKMAMHYRILLYDTKKAINILNSTPWIKGFEKKLKRLFKKRRILTNHYQFIQRFTRKKISAELMVLTTLPVLPPDLRPIIKMGNQIAASDLNRLYQRVIYRNERLRAFLKQPAITSSYEISFAQKLLQEAVDNLIQNGKGRGAAELDSRGRALKSLTEILKGKEGRFRQYLLGKRVDYSGRSVIVVGPKLKLHECGIPKEMAVELYLPFLLKRILKLNLTRTVVGAKALLKTNKPLVWQLLREIMRECPVLLNRAPTLHRLGFQAFQPKLVEGRAILLHPLVCPSFNADFDGDQMAVHVPITTEARAEAWKFMLSRNNLLSPATGEPILLPSQDMVLGCYYLTTNCNQKTIVSQRGSSVYFSNFEDVLKAYYQQKIDIHAFVWVKWHGLVESPHNPEQPIEIRVNLYGNYQEIYSKFHRTLDSNGLFLGQYICTTPGRILFNNLVQNLNL